VSGDWPSEDPTVRGGPPPSEDETVVQRQPPSEDETVVQEGGPPGPPPPEGPPPETAERELWPWLVGLLVLVVGGILLAYFLTRGGGHKTKEVPAVAGLPQQAAVSKLKEAGFKVTVKPTFSSKPQGTVVGTKPSGGSQADKGSTVTLLVSQGQKQVTVPNVLGLPQSEAVTQLTQAGLNSSVVLVPNAAPSGRVVSQAPGSGTKLSPGATVRLNVSKGRNQTTTVTKTVTNTQTRTQATTRTTPTTTSVTTTTATTTTTP
jgi:hypothetical protein